MVISSSLVSEILYIVQLILHQYLVDWHPIQGTQQSHFQELEVQSWPSLSLLHVALLARLLVSLWRESWSVW